MKISQYKCDNCKAEFESISLKIKCPSCNGLNFKKIDEREIKFGCGGGCDKCKGC